MAKSDSPKSLKDKTLLVLSWFPDKDGKCVSGIFVKDQVDRLKEHFKEIIVIDTVPYVPSLLVPLLPKHLRPFFSKKDYSYDNVYVHFPRFIRLPNWLGGDKKDFASLRLRAVMKVLKKSGMDFDLIHAHFTWPAGYIGLELKKAYHKPLITTVHENYRALLDELKESNPKNVAVWKESDAIIEISGGDLLKSRNKLCFHLPNGFKDEIFYPKKNAKERLGLPTGKKVILNVGGLVERKGQLDLIRALSEILKKRDDVLCYIIGRGSFEPTLRSAITKAGLEKNVMIMSDSVSNEDLSLWMNACDVFAFPSLSESFGIAQIEAMACGKPVVATRNGGSEHIIVSDELGALVEPGDCDGLAAALGRALEKKWDSKKIRAYALKFSLGNIVGQVLGVYHRVLARQDNGKKGKTSS